MADPTPTAAIPDDERAPLVQYVAPALDPWLSRAAHAVGMVDAGDLAEFAVRVERLAESAERIAALEATCERLTVAGMRAARRLGDIQAFPSMSAERPDPHATPGGYADGWDAALAAWDAWVCERIAALEADLAAEQERHRRAWTALCVIGEMVDAAGYPTLIPERALRVGEAVARLIADAKAAHAAGVREGREEAAESDRLLAAVEEWTHDAGSQYVPTGGDADTFGDGVRRAQSRVRNILNTRRLPSPAAPPVAGPLPDGFRLEGEATMCGGKGPDFCRKGASCRKHNRCVYGAALPRTGGAS